MTAPALALFPVTPAPTPDVRLDVRHLAPAVAELVRAFQNGDATCLEYRVVEDRRPCPFCDMAIDDKDAGGGDERAPVIAVVNGEWRHVHKLCAVKISGRISESNHLTLLKLPPCKHCGEPLVGGHTLYLTEGIGASRCENDADTTYQPEVA